MIYVVVEELIPEMSQESTQMWAPDLCFGPHPDDGP